MGIQRDAVLLCSLRLTRQGELGLRLGKRLIGVVVAIRGRPLRQIVLLLFEPVNHAASLLIE